MNRFAVVLALLLSLVPAVGLAQSLSLTGANAGGDCTGTSFHQAADASGQYLAAEWAAAGQFGVGINRGRVRCTIRFSVTVQTGYKLVAGGGSGMAGRLATAQMSPLRLNGASSRLLVESVVTIDNGSPASAAKTISGGPIMLAVMALDRPAGFGTVESVCSTPTKSSFQVTALVDAATASDYVIPWPPEAYVERETANMASFRLFYNVVPCRSVDSIR